MSRLIVKNLPSGLTDSRLRKVFEEYGAITDVSLKYRPNGNFRHFGFVGYKNESDAELAVEKLNNTFIDTAKIQVELCKQLGESEKHKSKLYDESTVTAKKGGKRSVESDSTTTAESSIFRDPKRQRVDKLRKILNNPLLSDDEKTMLKRVIDEPEFEQFLRMHGKLDGGNAGNNVWGNDEDPKENGGIGKADKPAADSDSVQDLAFLKEKIVKKVAAKENRASKTKSCLKLANLPPKATKSEIKLFMAPFKVVRIFRARKGAGFAFVQLETDALVDDAISQKNRNILKGRQVKLVAVKQAPDEKQELKQLESIAKHAALSNDDIETVAESGRLFARNLSYACTEEELQKHFSQHGNVSEVHLPVDRDTRKPKGFALITYLFPENAVTAFNQLDGTIFQGRVLHLLPAKAKTPTNWEHGKPAFPQFKADETTSHNEDADGSGKQLNEFQTERDRELKGHAGISHNWNTLFMSADVVAEMMSKRFNTSKRDILEGTSEDSGGASAAVRIALGEAQMVQETKEFLLKHGVNLDAFSQSAGSTRSKTVIVAKNFPSNYNLEEVRQVFARFGPIKTFVYPPHGVTALVEYSSSAEARAAFKALAYVKLGDTQRPLYLEWAPADALQKPVDQSADSTAAPSNAASSSCVFVKSVSFHTTEADLRAHFETVGVEIESVVIAMKRDPKSPAKRLSMGFGFVQLKNDSDAQKIVRELQHSVLDGAQLELSISRKDIKRTTAQAQDAVLVRQARQQDETHAPNKVSTKLCVRNVPFQATQKELFKLFQTMGPVKSVRLPQKPGGGGAGLSGQHRGFAFVEFSSKADAKRCMDAFSGSTHLYGRRLVLEWAQVADDADAEIELLREKTAIVAEQNKSVVENSKFKRSKLRESVAKTRVTFDNDVE